MREGEGLKRREGEKRAVVEAIRRKVAEMKVLDVRQTLECFCKECFGCESCSRQTVNGETLEP